MPEQQIDPRLVEQTRQHIRTLVAEINQLAGSDIPPQQFYGEFLQRVVLAVAGVGGALWTREGPQPPRLQHQVNFQMSGLLDEASLSAGHGALLMHSFSNGSAKLVPPRTGAAGEAEREGGSNSSDWSLLLAPLHVDKHTVGVVEVLLDPSRRQTAQENAVKFVHELCEIGSGYLKNRHLRQMLGQQQLWAQLESFVREIHSSLTPKEVAYIVANEAKRLVGCDRISVAIVYGRKVVVEGVSGQEVVDRKSTLVQLLSRLCNTVLQSNEDLFYKGEKLESLPPAVRDALDDYLAESGSKVIAVTLLRKPTKEAGPGKPFGTLVGEQLEDVSLAGTLTPRLEVVAQHGAIALSNALTHYRVFMLPVWRAVGNSMEWMRGNRLAKVAAAVGGVAAVTAAMVFIPLELRMEGKGTLVPENRRNIYAFEDAVVKRVLISDGEMVTMGQLLAEMESRELEIKERDLIGKLLDARNRKIGAIDKKDGAAQKAAEVDIQSFQEQLNLVKKQRESLNVLAPVAGMIATWDPKRTFEDRPIKRGDLLLAISQVESAIQCEHGGNMGWVLEIKMPEHKMGPVLEADDRRRKANDPEPLPASFILATDPQRRIRGHLEKIATTAEFDKDAKEHIVKVRVVLEGVKRVRPDLDQKTNKVTKVWLEFEQGDPLAVNLEAEVRVKVECGKRPMGYVLLREMIEFVYEMVIF